MSTESGRQRCSQGMEEGGTQRDGEEIPGRII